MTYRYVTGYCNEDAPEGSSNIGAGSTAGDTPNEEETPLDAPDGATSEPADDPEPKRPR